LLVVPETHQRERHLKNAYQNTITTNATMSTILVFNLAIAHHLMALEVMVIQQEEKKAFHFLGKAAKLYDLGLTLVHREHEIYSSSSLFVLASINNMALVHMAMHTNDVANHYLEQLLASLMCVIDGGGNIKFDGFLANTSYLILSAAPPAAAA
jgi:phosphoglycerate-specific signal transduction histidine kinase